MQVRNLLPEAGSSQIAASLSIHFVPLFMKKSGERRSFFISQLMPSFSEPLQTASEEEQIL